MSGNPRRKVVDPREALLAELYSEGMQRSQLDLDIITFARQILNIELWPTQRAILKALYNLPLERGQWRHLFNDPNPEYIQRKCDEYDVSPDDWWDERDILIQWRAEGKTTWTEGNDYRELCMEAGMRSSKSSLTSVIVTYEFFRLLQLADPAKYFGLMPGSLIALLVLATSEDQAQDTLFAAIKGRIDNSAYFQGLIRQKQIIVNTMEILCPEKNLKLWAGHSRCVAAGTFVATMQGLKRIESLVPTSEAEQVFDVDFHIPTLQGDKHITKGISMGKQPTLKLRTCWGYELEGSHRHPILVMGRDGKLVWKTLPELTVGDFVALKRGWSGGEPLLISPEFPYGFEYKYPKGSSNTNDFVPPIRMTPDLARFMGYLTGDGSATISDRVGLKSMDESLVADLRQLCNRLFNTELQLGTVQENNSSRMYWAYNKKLKAFLEWLGMASVKAPEKRVPWSILQADEASISSFLRGLFDTDGYASQFDKTIGLTSTSEELLKDVQLLLLKLGIICQKIKSGKALGPREYRGKVIDNKHDTYDLLVCGSEVDKFLNKVGFSLERKTTAVPERKFKVIEDVIPYVHNVVQEMRKIELTQRGWRERVAPDRIAAWHLIRKTVYNSHAPGREDHGGMSLLKLNRVIKYFERVAGCEPYLEYLENLCNADLFFDPVVELTTSEAYLYDFEVPDSHHFFSNGIISHNSAGLVGRTLMIFAMDEGNRFGIEVQGGATGIDMYANVGKGTTTLARYGSKKIVISSAWCEGDLTDTLYDRADNGSDHILAFRLATWDINPIFAKLKEQHPEIKADYATRGIEAARDYAGVRPGLEENFFNKYVVQKCMKHPTQVQYRPVINEYPGPDGVRRYSGIDLVFPAQIVKPPMFSFGHMDPALVSDGFAFVTAHPFVDPVSGILKIKVTTLVEWRAVDQGRGNVVMIDFQDVVEKTKLIAPALQLKRLTFDHWNSAMHIQMLYSAGISTEQWKSHFSQVEQRKIYVTLREWMDQDRILLPPVDESPAATKLYKELTELKLVNGRQIKHPPKGSKDLADALACVVFRISQDERRFRYHEMGTNNIKTLGTIHAASTIQDLFQDEKTLEQRSKLVDPRRITPGTNPIIRKTSTRITQQDW